MSNFAVEFFEKEDGTYPAEEFILSLDIKMRAKAFRTLELLELKGNFLREPYSKHLEDGIFELRIKQSNNIARVLYFFVIGNRVILTNGFIKKTQKTPTKEIEISKQRRKEFKQRSEKND
ncbi:type II toxin-antitoxin system RelE/ParE family toxin [Peptococcus simiae]|uniref:Type II toxin-antitoxin system RelE/ParE family toxin n=1 Tax=Peptococcus simiae TaxID=1643805 RepID=A0ABW9H0S1_9FIRM